MLLTKKKMQKYLKKLGFYNGKIDGKIGMKTKNAIFQLQAMYFNHDEVDSIYGKKTDILLRNAYNVKKYCPDFDIQEFRCGCHGTHCTGYPAVLNTNLLKGVQKIRVYSGQTTITSGLRCKKHNSKLTGSSPTSRHLTGKAVDFINDITKTEKGRLNMLSFCKKIKGYHYAYCNINGNHPNMGTAIHFDVK